MFGKSWSSARVWRLILWPVTALYCAVVASIVFAPVHVDDNEMGGRLAQARPHVLYSGFLVSACIETIQSFMPDRTGDPVDVLMNGSGALLGAAGALGVHRWRCERRERQGK